MCKHLAAGGWVELSVGRMRAAVVLFLPLIDLPYRKRTLMFNPSMVPTRWKLLLSSGSMHTKNAVGRLD